jgi:quercetin dioxygenase-like cupin family protein
VVTNFPFVEEILEGKRIRTFSADVDDEELVWHRDNEDRIVRVLSSEGWFLQMDEKLPVELKQGDVHTIPKNSWHRVIRKRNCRDLVVEITAGIS